MAEPLLQIDKLNIGFETARGLVRPVRDVSLTIYPGQTVAVVGESGCGKSVTAMSILRLIPSPPSKVLGGSIRFKGQDLLGYTERQMQSVRGREIAMIFQEPMTSLNPVYSIGDQIAEAVALHQNVGSREAMQIAEQSLRDVGIADAGRRLREYPHEMSGGMRQRIMIAMALSCKPKLLIADEPTTALDVTIQAQILELLRKIQKQTGMAIMLITHDLGVVAENADVVNVMYASRVVETATVEDLFDKPQHPYTKGLFRSIPKLGVTSKRLDTIAGTVPNPVNFPGGCKFHPRCPLSRELAANAPADKTMEITATGETFRVMRRCVSETPVTPDEPTSGEPMLREVQKNHWAACHFAEGFGSAPATSAQLAHKRQDEIPLATEVQGVSDGTHSKSIPLSYGADSPLLSVRDLKTHFPIRSGVFSRTVAHVKAVDGVSFDLAPGKTLGLVGESGCGKTTVGRTILRLIPATSGEVIYRGKDFFAYRGEELRKLRRHMQIIFQDPVSSLNPRMTVGNIIGEPIEVHGIAKGSEKQDRVASLLARVGLDPGYATRYPHEFSGGQRQRIGIARAISLSPEFIVCDEPVSALDVSIQSQILNLLNDLQDELKIAYLFIAHNLAVVEHFSDDVAVMYLGRIVEKANGRELYTNPKHPYTESLLSAVPEPNPRPKKKRIVLAGEVPSPANPPTGCPFHPRCPLARLAAKQAGPGETVEIKSGGETFRVLRKCVEEVPPLEPKQGEPGHLAACWVTK